MSTITVRPATPADFPPSRRWRWPPARTRSGPASDPAYLAYLLEYGTLLVGGRDGAITGFGATRLIGHGPDAVSMLCDLFVHPGTHGRGCGRAILSQLWPDGTAPRRMTFSSQHAHALPLYTRFGLDAWWPLLYLAGEVAAVRAPDGWTASPASVSRGGGGGAGLDRRGPLRRSPGLGGPAARAAGAGLPARGTGRGGHGRRARGGVRPGPPGHRAGSPRRGRGTGRAGQR